MHWGHTRPLRGLTKPPDHPRSRTQRLSRSHTCMRAHREKSRLRDHRARPRARAVRRAALPALAPERVGNGPTSRRRKRPRLRRAPGSRTSSSSQRKPARAACARRARPRPPRRRPPLGPRSLQRVQRTPRRRSEARLQAQSARAGAESARTLSQGQVGGGRRRNFRIFQNRLKSVPSCRGWRSWSPTIENELRTTLRSSDLVSTGSWRETRTSTRR